MEEIEARVEEILADVPSYVWDGKRLPIPVEEIASSYYGLLVRDVEDLCAAPGCPKLDADETLSGLLMTARGEIWVNASEGRQWPARRRFTIGHELGHWVLHRDRADETVFCRSNLVQPDAQLEDEPPEVPDIEEEASMFAAALLMPADFVRSEYSRNRDFEHLRTVFEASGAAMGRRLHSVI